MELLADKGNGHYAYIDSFTEARKVLSEQLEGTLVTVAKDVKLQIEFNPLHVASWRQIGYENRQLAARDFNDDAKDAGDAGAGHAVTALYEVVPTGAALASVGGPLRYQPRGTPSRVEDGLGQHSNELLLVKVRYKQPTADSSERLELPLLDSPSSFKEASADFKWAAAVAGYGMLLRDSPHRGTTTFDSVLAWAQDGMGRDAQGYRSEFIDLVRRAQSMRSR
jgi:Ca-activated chloride channel family protein